MAASERRDHARFRLWVPARIEGASEETQLAIGHDVSQGGALLVTAEQFEVGRAVKLFVRIPPQEGPELEVNASVLRCAPNPEDPQGLWPFQVAVEFDAPVPELEQLLREHAEVVEGLADAGEQIS